MALYYDDDGFIKDTDEDDKVSAQTGSTGSTGGGGDGLVGGGGGDGSYGSAKGRADATGGTVLYDPDFGYYVVGGSTGTTEVDKTLRGTRTTTPAGGFSGGGGGGGTPPLPGPGFPGGPGTAAGAGINAVGQAPPTRTVQQPGQAPTGDMQAKYQAYVAKMRAKGQTPYDYDQWFWYLNNGQELTGDEGTAQGETKTYPLPEGYDPQFTDEQGNIWKWNLHKGTYDAAGYKPPALKDTKLPDMPTQPAQEGYRWEWDGKNWVPTPIPASVKQLELEMQKLAQDKAAQERGLGASTEFERQRLELDRQRLAQEREIENQRIQMQRDQQLAELRAKPGSWLEYAALSKTTPAVQPWMLPLAQQQYKDLYQPGAALPGWGGQTPPPTTAPGIFTGPKTPPDTLYPGGSPRFKEEAPPGNVAYPDAGLGGALGPVDINKPQLPPGTVRDHRYIEEPSPPQLPAPDQPSTRDMIAPTFPGTPKPPGAWMNPPRNMPDVPTNIPKPVEPPTGLPSLVEPSRQYQARMGPTALSQYAGYEQARTGITPQELDYRLWSKAPPSGKNRGVKYA